jgi:NADH:ubiquinone oxidoreductase subunit E
MHKEEVTREADLARVNELVTEYNEQKWALIPLLQKIQNEFG